MPEQDDSTNDQSFETRDASVPLTRREMRAREKAALPLTETPNLMSQQAPAPVAAPAPEALLPAAAAPAVPPTIAAPAVAAPAVVVPQPTIASTSASAAESSHADVTSSTDDVVAGGRGPRKPSILRPVKPPRGISRPQRSAPASRRPPVAAHKRKPFKRRLLSKLMTFGAMIGAGLMMVATSIPANAFYSADEQTGAVAAPAEAEIQSISVEPAADLTLTRDGYTATSFREQIFLRYGNRSFLYQNNPVGAIQWPFPIAVPISDAFGYRLDNCGGYCSDWHKGVDFLGGEGNTIQAIADGVVSLVEPSHAGLGNHVIIDHQVNGKLVQSVYAHMQDNSMKVVVGQVVKVGSPVGLVGTTGESTGPHLHFEIHIGGEPVDPFEWLKANATP